MEFLTCYDFVSEEKELGILIDDKLCFPKYIGKAATRSNSVLGMIKQSISFIDQVLCIII